VVIPQLFLCGLLVPRDQMPDWLQIASNAMPLSYSVDALAEIANNTTVTTAMLLDLAVVLGFVIVALCAAAATLRRRTP